MKANIYFALLLSAVYSCKVNTGKEEVTSPVPKSFSPAEVSVDSFIYVRNAGLVPAYVKNRLDASYNVVILTNADETEILSAYQDTGLLAGSFIGYQIKQISSNDVVDWDFPIITTKVPRFTTTNGIYLHMPVTELLKIKGEPSEKKSSDGITSYLYLEEESNRKANEQYAFYCEAVNGAVLLIRAGYR